MLRLVLELQTLSFFFFFTRRVWIWIFTCASAVSPHHRSRKRGRMWEANERVLPPPAVPLIGMAAWKDVGSRWTRIGVMITLPPVPVERCSVALTTRMWSKTLGWRPRSIKTKCTRDPFFRSAADRADRRHRHSIIKSTLSPFCSFPNTSFLFRPFSIFSPLSSSEIRQ